MAKLIWDEVGKKLFETGTKNGVLYVRDTNGAYLKGVAWNGLTGVTESPSGAEATPLYADDTKYLNLMSAEEFGATIQAYTYPDEFEECDGSKEIAPGVTVGQQSRKVFGMAYKTVLGNDIDGNDYGYKLHLIYGALAAPSEKEYKSINDSPEAITLSWEIKTTPVQVTGFKPTASLIIDSTKVDAAKLTALENILFGTVGADARLPLPDEIASIIGSATPSALALSTIVPEDKATGVALDANVVATFNNKILKESIVVTTATGTIVQVAKSFDATGKILTINPVANLTANTVYIVTVGGVTDVYGQSLDPVVKSFTTVAA